MICLATFTHLFIRYFSIMKIIIRRIVYSGCCPRARRRSRRTWSSHRPSTFDTFTHWETTTFSRVRKLKKEKINSKSFFKSWKLFLLRLNSFVKFSSTNNCALFILTTQKMFFKNLNWPTPVSSLSMVDLDRWSIESHKNGNVNLPPWKNVPLLVYISLHSIPVFFHLS